MLEWWFIPMNIVLSSTAGSLIGFIVALLIRPPKDYFKFTIVQIGIGNIGNVPLVLIGAVCGDKNNPFGDSEICNQMGSAYISFGQWVGAVILYTYVFHMLAPPQASIVKESLESKADATKIVITDSTRVPLLEAEEGTVDNRLKLSDWRSRAMKVISQASLLFERLKIKQILQPPILASVLAMVIGIIPFLKQILPIDD